MPLNRALPAALAVLIVACSTTGPVVQRTEDFEAVVEVDGLERSYQVHLPTGYDEDAEWPLLVALHPSGVQGIAMRSLSGLDATADEWGFIVAYPDAVGGWRWDDSFADEVDDVAFIHELIEQMRDFVSLDENRLYVTGFSAGGWMAHRLACSMTGNLAGAAIVSASLPELVATSCYGPAPLGKIAILMLNGTDDAVVPWEGEPPGTEYRLLSVPESIALWAGMNDCGGDAPVSTPIEADSAGGIRVTYEAYQGCPGTIEQGLYAIEGGAHIWPSPYFAANDSIASFLLRQLRR